MITTGAEIMDQIFQPKQRRSDLIAHSMLSVILSVERSAP